MVHLLLGCLALVSAASAQVVFDICDQAKAPGYGDEKSLKYYYDGELRRCRFLFYKGKGGNGNHFDTLNKCVSTCEDVIDPSFGGFTYPQLDDTKCDDNYHNWKIQTVPSTNAAATSTCITNGFKIACPLTAELFIQWLLNKTESSGGFWLGGKQGQFEHFNYVYWNSNQQIESYITYKIRNGGQKTTNMWESGQPKYGIGDRLCVKGIKGHLSMDTCSKQLSYYCSP